MIMNNLMNIQTMSSREIAEYTGKRHSDVMRDIRNLLSKLNGNHNERMSALVEKSNDEVYHRGDRTQYKYLRKDTVDYIFDHAFTDHGYCFYTSEYIDSKGESRPEYLLTKKDTLLLISGYDVVLRSEIINRWEQLETKPQNTLDSITRKDLAKMLFEAEEEKERLVHQIEEQKPKALFADAVATSDRSCLVGELAKVLKQNGIEIGQNRLFKWMRDHNYLCSKGEYYNTPTQKSMEIGLFEMKKTVIAKPDGTVLTTFTTKVTGKGQIYFVNKFLPVHA